MSDLDFVGSNWTDVAGYVSSHNDTYPLIDPAGANLMGKSALITGASKGIGKATAISFATAGCSKILLAARSDLGDVEIAMHDAASKAGQPQPLILSLKVDVSSEDSVRAAAKKAADLLNGGLDILVSNAGYMSECKPLAESEPSGWWRTWEVNMKGPYLAARFFLPLLLRSPTKTIINVTSGGAHVIFPGYSSYATTKFALCRLNEFLDKEYSAQGLIAIALHPGAVRTELAMHIPPERRIRLTDTPELPGDTMVWLARERRDWLGGRFASANWDMGELEQKREEIVQKNLFKFRSLV